MANIAGDSNHLTLQKENMEATRFVRCARTSTTTEDVQQKKGHAINAEKEDTLQSHVYARQETHTHPQPAGCKMTRTHPVKTVNQSTPWPELNGRGQGCKRNVRS